jgi:hypothetical protein
MVRCCSAVLLLCASLVARGQMNMGGPTQTLRDNVLRHMGSGTSVEPNSTAPPQC